MISINSITSQPVSVSPDGENTSLTPEQKMLYQDLNYVLQSANNTYQARRTAIEAIVEYINNEHYIYVDKGPFTQKIFGLCEEDYGIAGYELRLIYYALHQQYEKQLANNAFPGFREIIKGKQAVLWEAPPLSWQYAFLCDPAFTGHDLNKAYDLLDGYIVGELSLEDALDDKCMKDVMPMRAIHWQMAENYFSQEALQQAEVPLTPAMIQYSIAEFKDDEVIFKRIQKVIVGILTTIETTNISTALTAALTLETNISSHPRLCDAVRGALPHLCTLSNAHRLPEILPVLHQLEIKINLQEKTYNLACQKMILDTLVITRNNLNTIIRLSKILPKLCQLGITIDLQSESYFSDYQVLFKSLLENVSTNIMRQAVEMLSKIGLNVTLPQDQCFNLASNIIKYAAIADIRPRLSMLAQIGFNLAPYRIELLSAVNDRIDEFPDSAAPAQALPEILVSQQGIKKSLIALKLLAKIAVRALVIIEVVAMPIVGAMMCIAVAIASYFVYKNTLEDIHIIRTKELLKLLVGLEAVFICMSIPLIILAKNNFKNYYKTFLRANDIYRLNREIS